MKTFQACYRRDSWQRESRQQTWREGRQNERGQPKQPNGQRLFIYASSGMGEGGSANTDKAGGVVYFNAVNVGGRVIHC